MTTSGVDIRIIGRGNMERDRLTSRGWTWHQGLVRYLDVEEAMFKCDEGCKSCDRHSEELESAHRYATHSVTQPVPHMDEVAGEKLKTMTNRELGNELDRWADRRDNFPNNLDSIALRVTADRLRAMEEGCDHPLAHRYRHETQDFCQNCGAIVDDLGETVNKWTCEEPGVYRFDATRDAIPRGGSRADGPLLRPGPPRTDCGVTTKHAPHGEFNTDRRWDTYCSGHLIDDSQGGDVRGIPTALQGLTQEQVDDLGDLQSALGSLTTTLDGVANAMDIARSAGVSDKDALKGWLKTQGMMDDSLDAALDRAFAEIAEEEEADKEEEDGPHGGDCQSTLGQGECDCTIRGYDDEASGGEWHPEDEQTGPLNRDCTGSGVWWKSHEGVKPYAMHFHSGSLDQGGDVSPTNHRHNIEPIQFCSNFTPHVAHTHNRGSRFCKGLNTTPLPDTRCVLRIRHEAHDWPNYSATGVKRHCDGKGRP